MNDCPVIASLAGEFQAPCGAAQLKQFVFSRSWDTGSFVFPPSITTPFHGDHCKKHPHASISQCRLVGCSVCCLDELDAIVIPFPCMTKGRVGLGLGSGLWHIVSTALDKFQ